MFDNEQKPKDPTAIEDLTVSETETANVKGGAVDMFLRLDGVKGESGDHKYEGR